MRHRFFDAESRFDLEAGANAPTYHAHAYSGGKLFVQQFDYPVVLDLSTIKGGDVENLLRHQKGFVAGKGTLEIFDDRIEATGKLDVPGLARNEIMSSFKAGKKWQVSIGWSIDMNQAGSIEPELVPDGERRQINGRTQVGPFFHARGGLIPEVSFVDQGGDVENHVSLAAKRKLKGDSMKKELIDYGVELGISDPTKLDENGVLVLEASFATFNKQPPAPTLKEGDRQTIDFTAQVNAFTNQLEETRKSANESIIKSENIRSLCARYGHPNVTVGEGDAAREISLVAFAIENDLGENEVELKAKLWKLEQEEKVANVSAGHQFGGLALTAAANDFLAAAALCREYDVEEVSKTFEATRREEIMNEAVSGKYREMGVVDLCKMSLKAMGRPFTGLGHGPDFANLVVEEHRRHHLTASVGAATILNLSNILENTMNKSLMMSFQRTPSTWREISHTYAATDYKAHSFYRLTMGGGFKPVGDNGQIKHATIVDSKNTASVEDFGVMLTLTTKMIVNDDMNALAGLGNSLGMHAGRKIDEVLYELLLTSSTLFVAARNLITTTPLSYGALEAIDDHFDGLLDADNKPIDVNWDKLVVGNGYKRLAGLLSREENMGALARNAANSAAVTDIDFGTNEFAGAFKPVHSKWISPKKAAGQDPTDTQGDELTAPAAGNQTYFAVCSPEANAEYQPIRVGHLNGVTNPMVSSGSLNFDVAGIGYKAEYNFGVDEGDHEGILKITSN